MATRAIHSEVTNNLTALELINILRRFISRRGTPALIISDNATNFKYSNEILSMEDTDTIRANTTVQTFLTNEKIRWKFITPLSPWKGGFYERLVGMIKLTLKRVLTRKLKKNETTFLTRVLECEAMVNSRPLAYPGSTLEDSLIIRPIDFLIPKANLLPISGTITIDDNHDTECSPYVSTKDQAIQYYRTQMTYLKCLWHEWHNTYLLELRIFHQHRIKQKSSTRPHPKIGEVVLVMDEKLTRLEWPLSLITDLITDQDGTVRSVELRTSKSDIERSVNMFSPLELNSENERKANPQGHNSITDNDSIHNDTITSSSIDSSNDNPSTKQRTRPMLPRKAKLNKNYSTWAVPKSGGAINGTAPNSKFLALRSPTTPLQGRQTIVSNEQ
uniref:Integrase catalytic domain-containing protein n=1 Tax=Haemonchus contortus TaxID=6289 RepID=A0A7I4Z606_HAECO